MQSGAGLPASGDPARFLQRGQLLYTFKNWNYGPVGEAATNGMYKSGEPHVQTAGSTCTCRGICRNQAGIDTSFAVASTEIHMTALQERGVRVG